MIRRDFLQRASLACATSLAASLAPVWVEVLARDTPSPVAAGLTRLNTAQERLVIALAEGIIPTTDTPGATTAGVPEFIAVLFTDWLFPREQLEFAAGLDELDAAARAARGDNFADLSSEVQVELLVSWDRTAIAQQQVRQEAPFFTRFKSLVITGYYTSKIGQESELKVQLGGGQDDVNGPVVMPPPFRI